MRKILDGLFYVIKMGGQWEWVPYYSSAKGAVYYHYRKLQKHRVLHKILKATNGLVRKQEDRISTPTLGLNSQSTKTTHKGCERGIDGNKKVKGRNRHIIIDTLACLLAIMMCMPPTSMTRKELKG